MDFEEGDLSTTYGDACSSVPQLSLAEISASSGSKRRFFRRLRGRRKSSTSPIPGSDVPAKTRLSNRVDIDTSLESCNRGSKSPCSPDIIQQTSRDVANDTHTIAGLASVPTAQDTTADTTTELTVRQNTPQRTATDRSSAVVHMQQRDKAESFDTHPGVIREDSSSASVPIENDATQGRDSLPDILDSKVTNVGSTTPTDASPAIGRTSINTTLDARSVRADVMDTIFFEDELQADGYYDDIE
eukprot:m.194632 g.194632  ORF g.194632 m.194632 type:complete len:244 (+) comp18655_c0_seq1:596-1327(+)